MARRIRTSARELAGQLSALALALWTVAALNSITSTPYLRSGQVRGTDFVQFYTLARLSATGQLSRFDDFDAIRSTQLASVPQASKVWFPPVYGPQVPLALTPLGWLSYNGALLLWVSLSLVAYVFLCRLLIGETRVLSAFPKTALLGALTFPAFWQLVQHGQLTIMAVAIIVAVWRLLRLENPIAAGALLGLLVYKPPLLAPILVILFFAGEWRMWVPASLSALAEVLLTGLWVGMDGLKRYVLLMLHLPSMSALLFTKPEQSHGLKAFWTILVGQSTAALVLYALSAAAAIALAVRIWKSSGEATPKMMTLVVATALAAPYLFVYDLTILAPAWIWMVDWFLSRRVPAVVGRALYAGYLAPLAAPLVPFVHIQVSVPCLAFLLYALWRYRDAPFLDRPAAAPAPAIG